MCPIALLLGVLSLLVLRSTHAQADHAFVVFPHFPRVQHTFFLCSGLRVKATVVVLTQRYLLTVNSLHLTGEEIFTRVRIPKLPD